MTRMSRASFSVWTQKTCRRTRELILHPCCPISLVRCLMILFPFAESCSPRSELEETRHFRLAV